jgi:uncharacterized protein (DUF736 family)
MIIGIFNFDSKENSFQGNLMTLVVQHQGIFLRPAEKSGDKEPDYRVIAETEMGPVEFGAAWKRTSERGQEFLSVSLDDPSFGAPINCAMFQDEGADTAKLVWTRAKPKPAVATTAGTGKERKAKAA